jgi:GH15 family glucan-1,4-alpha-glucosidase
MPRPAPRADQRPIADYALIGDLRGAALVAVDGAIDWLCLPRFDSTPVFFALLDAGRGGACTIAPDGVVEDRTRRYLPATNILETTLVTTAGRLVVTDCMPVRAIADIGDTGPDCEAPGRLVRRIACAAGRVALTLRVAPRFNWGRSDAMPIPTPTAVGAAYRDADLHVACSRPLSIDNGDLVCRTTLNGGETLLLVLGHGPCLDGAALDAVPAQLSQTETYWRAWASQSTYRGRHADAVLRSALCLKLLTYAPSGALIAAPTAGLPEAIGGARNWDYRYVWARDASFSISAFLNLGYRREAAEFLRFLHEADGHGGGDEVLRVMYAIDGAANDKERTLGHLAGWRGSRPVMIGNSAGEQRQHEIYGELLAALNLYVTAHGTDGLCPDLRADIGQFVRRLADTAMARWRTPDQGIWELRGAPRHLLHTKVMCWVALDRAIALAPRIGIGAEPRWLEQRETIRADCLRHGWNAEAGALTMEYGGTALDMATLRLALMDFLPADDPLLAATLAVSERTLDAGTGDLFYRYRFDDGLPGREGAFAACTFWVAGLHAMAGAHERAADLLERMLERANNVGLFAEQIDPATGEQLGNFPQGFTHMALIHEVTRASMLAARPPTPSAGPSC